MSISKTVAPPDPVISPQTLDDGVWEAMAGMDSLRSLVERRVMLPLTERVRAEKHGLSPCATILLFGPPGTGKTTLVRAMAGRLGWAYVDVDLSMVALSSSRLRRLFELLFQLEHAVICLDEFEHLGLKRDNQTTPIEPLTSGLMRGLPALRASGRLLIVCVTNHIRLLDAALLRPGRFDMVIPVGLPDDADRAALLRHFLARHRCSDVDIEEGAQRSIGFTRADLEAICQRAAQAAFEREIDSRRESRVQSADLIDAMEKFRRSVTGEDMEAFEQDIARFERL